MKNKKFFTINSLKNRACDSIQSSRQSMLWRVFEGCGHLFHIECNLPDISVCNICKELLTTKASSLGKTVNSESIIFDPLLDVQQSDDNEDELSDKDEDCDSDECDHEQHDETKNEQAVLDLITQVNALHRFEGPQL